MLTKPSPLLLIALGMLIAPAALPAGPVRAEPNDQKDKKPPFPPPDTTWPTEVGVHHLSYEHAHGDKKRMLTYGLYVPRQYDAAVNNAKKLPMIVFLCGKGSRGLTEDKLHREGPLMGMRRSKGFAKSVDYFILAPQVPADERWENPFMGSFSATIARRVIDQYPVDPDRVYLVGMSMGGEGVWHAAMADPALYAVITSVGGRAHPQPAKVAKALKDRTNLIIVGSGDKDFTTGSQAMADAFNAVDADVLHVEIPGRGHDIWGFYMPRAEFYQWMLLHRRGQAPPEDRASAEDILNWAMRPPEDPEYHKFAENLQKQFHAFQPWWFVDNCRRFEGAGRVGQALGRSDVFVTEPLNGHIPCRIMHTTTIPKDKKTTLHLSVAHDQNAQWLLVVNVEAHRQLKREVKHKDKRQVWADYQVDLTRFAGKEVFIEILNRARGKGPHTAYWHRIELISEDK